MQPLQLSNVHRSAFFSLAAIGSLAGVALVIAGNIDPPAGPVGPTFKTLTEIEPRFGLSLATAPGDTNSVIRISQPGSYYLLGPVLGAAGKHGIEIEADNVTLDLNGFAVSGVTGAIDGISVPTARRNIVIKNGTVRGFPLSGIFAKNVNGGMIRDVIVQGNQSDGLWTGSEMLVQNVQVISNGNHGFVIDQRTQVIFESCQAVDNDAGFQGSNSRAMSFKDCSARDNREQGFFVGDENRFVNCQAVENDFGGFEAGQRARFESCVSQFNTRRGFSVTGGASMADCSAANNGQDGINVSFRSQLQRCVGLQNGGNGIVAAQGSMVIDCEATLNTAAGIVAGNGCSVERCNSNENSGVGIFAADGCTIRASTTFFNSLDGIRVNAACSVIDNNLQGDGGAVGPQGGIRVEGGAGNRIEGNNMVGCDNSILTATAAAQGNFIARNTSRSPASAHFTIGAGNSFGPIITVTGVGNFAATPNSTHPMANFIY